MFRFDSVKMILVILIDIALAILFRADSLGIKAKKIKKTFRKCYLIEENMVIMPVCRRGTAQHGLRGISLHSIADHH